MMQGGPGVATCGVLPDPDATGVLFFEHAVKKFMESTINPKTKNDVRCILRRSFPVRFAAAKIQNIPCHLVTLSPCHRFLVLNIIKIK
jgi:hypothetical protein